ncbi:MAG: NADH:ubiquinone reductase (Na(+)-transporting) subunit C [Verrucomicrobia bacterium]|nr:NADH:ubiquinone reductase (Na(+)-transporting) subunit C [Kiritimatiellia bacterium]MCB1101359.1 NADH:ubiquinone reductase (Na(+)-transporting) subunit C [Kiritimatiellia bacterium]MCP5488300.1 NADH:ubiquinone reductase (Na(+)-transporting) subunit C [Verrucomicrobiota bacterium]
MRKDDLYAIGFAALVCVVCSLVLSATAQLLKERQDMEVELDRKLNVLKAFGVPVVDEAGKKLSKEKVDTYFETNISEVFLDKETGDLLTDFTSADLPPAELRARTIEDKEHLPLYVWRDDGQIQKYAFPISGMGLWSIVYGYMALDRDLSTIIGVTFYKHGETPGLGGEVSTEWFQSQFHDKVIYKDGELQPIQVVKGEAPAGSDHQVDGISGATMTGNGLNQFMNRDLQYYNRYFSKVRGS